MSEFQLPKKRKIDLILESLFPKNKKCVDYEGFYSNKHDVKVLLMEFRDKEIKDRYGEKCYL
jgi:hypothetical protein